MNQQMTRRSGGRAARIAARARALPEELRPIRPGMSGGRYRPLREEDLSRIHTAALDVLAEIGLCDAPPSGVAAMTAIGAVASDDGRLRFPRALVEDVLAQANRQITLFSRDGQADLDLSGQRVHFGTAGAAVHMVEAETRRYRESTLQDLHDAAKIVQTLDNVHFFQRPMVARDVPDPCDLDINTIYASVTGTTKHIGTSFSDAAHVDLAVEMLHAIAGGEAAWRARPFVSNSNCFVVPPLKFATESCSLMEAAIRGGMPVLLLSAGQAGATAPASIAGAIVQAVAECLAGLVYVHAINPRHPVIFGTWPFVSDLRTGAMSGGSGEQALLTAGCAQMHHFYGIPGGAAAGMADSKLPDMQAGWEQAMSNVMAGLSGLNMVYEAVGMHASLLGFCHESLILGNDMIGQALRCVRGIEVDDDTIGLETMRATCMGGPGHYLGSEHTLKRMQSDYVYPTLADRSSPKEWEERQKPDLITAARLQKERTIADRSHAALPAELDQDIRARFNILLDPT